MAFTIVGAIGGIILVFILASLIEWLVVSRIMDNPMQGTSISVVLAYCIAVFVYTWNSGLPYSYAATMYLPGLLVVMAIQIWRQSRIEPDTSEIDDVFK